MNQRPRPRGRTRLAACVIALLATLLTACVEAPVTDVRVDPASIAFSGERALELVADVVAFLAGGLVVYALFCFMGFGILRIGWNIFWYLLMMFAIGTVSFPAALGIAAVLAVGLVLVVLPAAATPSAEWAAARPHVPNGPARQEPGHGAGSPG